MRRREGTRKEEAWAGDPSTALLKAEDDGMRTLGKGGFSLMVPHWSLGERGPLSLQTPSPMLGPTLS